MDRGRRKIPPMITRVDGTDLKTARVGSRSAQGRRLDDSCTSWSTARPPATATSAPCRCFDPADEERKRGDGIPLFRGGVDPVVFHHGNILRTASRRSAAGDGCFFHFSVFSQHFYRLRFDVTLTPASRRRIIHTTVYVSGLAVSLYAAASVSLSCCRAPF